MQRVVGSTLALAQNITQWTRAMWVRIKDTSLVHLPSEHDFTSTTSHSPPPAYSICHPSAQNSHSTKSVWAGVASKAAQRLALAGAGSGLDHVRTRDDSARKEDRLEEGGRLPALFPGAGCWVRLFDARHQALCFLSRLGQALYTHTSSAGKSVRGCRVSTRSLFLGTLTQSATVMPCL